MTTMHEIEQRLRMARPESKTAPPPLSRVLGLMDQAGRANRRPRWWRRGRVVLPLGLVIIALTGAGGSALLFATGKPLPSWSVLPANPNMGLGRTVPSSLAVLHIRVPDPNGGPPWGMRVIETTRGEACLQGGRVVNGRLGGLGIGYAFKADGRFHPFAAADAVNYDSCATLDGHGIAFQPNAPQIVAASGLPLAGENVSSPDALRCNLPNVQTTNVRCPQSDLREVAMGMLGPDATNIRVNVPGRHRGFTVTPYGRDGTYLIVLPVTRGNTPRMATLYVTYKNGSQCQIPAVPHARACMPEGIELPSPMPTSKQVATPLHVRYLASAHAQTPLAVTARGDQSAPPRITGHARVSAPALEITFDAPVAAPNVLSAYDVELQPHAVQGCQTPARIIGQPTSEDITEGQHVHITLPLEDRCATTYSGRVFFAKSFGSHSEARESHTELEGPLYEVIGEHFGEGQRSSRFPTVGRFKIAVP